MVSTILTSDILFVIKTIFIFFLIICFITCVSKCAKKLSTSGHPITISIHSSSSTRPPSPSMITYPSTVPLLSHSMNTSFCSNNSGLEHSFLHAQNLQSEAVVILHPLSVPQTPPPPYSDDPPPPYVPSIS